MSPEKVRRTLESRLVEQVNEYHRTLARDVGPARDRLRWRYEYAETARRDFREASSRVSELRGRIDRLSRELDFARVGEDALLVADLREKCASAAEELARAKVLASAADAVLSRPEFRLEHADYAEAVAALEESALQESRKLRQALIEAFDRGEREILGDEPAGGTPAGELPAGDPNRE